MAKSSNETNSNSSELTDSISTENNSTDTENTSSSSLELELEAHIPTVSEISILLTQTSFISDPISFLEKMNSCKVLKSDSTILAVFGVVEYNLIRGCLSKNFKKSVNSLIEKSEVKENIGFILSPRFNNIPLDQIYKLYSSLEFTFDYFIIVSELYTVEKNEILNILSSFPEFNKDDLRNFPKLVEQVFLLHSKFKQNTEILGQPARIVLISKSEFSEFLNRFSLEIK